MIQNLLFMTGSQNNFNDHKNENRSLCTCHKSYDKVANKRDHVVQLCMILACCCLIVIIPALNLALPHKEDSFLSVSFNRFLLGPSKGSYG